MRLASTTHHDLEASLGYIRQDRWRPGFKETRVVTSFPAFNCFICLQHFGR